ncbi:MAG TPA: glycosyltransferase family 4 protein [Holophaga sp.]|nr:glycosyltransferase family 4 protein [Holophaga sp.]
MSEPGGGHPRGKDVFPAERIAFLGGFAPRLCGIATFTTDLCEAVAAAAPKVDCFAGAMNDRVDGYAYPPRVRFELDQKDLDSYRRAADFLNFSNCKALCLQHEFGIFGGPAGSHILALLREARMPVVTTLHTVLRDPDPAQAKVMAELVRRSTRLVVMARKGAEILQETYGVQASRIDVIPHGIPDMPFLESSFFKARLGLEGREVLLTFGLIGPSKGIEFAIEALPMIIQKHPKVVYLVLGATHPHLLARDGENYRLALERLAEARGVRDHVLFYNRFVSLEDLKQFIGAADIYVTPYLSEAQITSGTLAYVFGAGKAVVSTPYWHAQELLAEGRGILVPFREAGALAEAVCRYLEGPELMRSVRERAYQLGRTMVWPKVASRYLESFRSACGERRSVPRAPLSGWTAFGRPYALPPLRLDHLQRLTDTTGILQHAFYNVPNVTEGYCTDDNARAYLLCTLLDEMGGEEAAEVLERLATFYLAFLSAALNRETGRFRNFMSYGRVWLDDPGSEDCHARALWALGTGVGHSRNEGHRKLALHLFREGLPAAGTFHSPRAIAFTLIGLHAFLGQAAAFPGMRELALERLDRLLGLWDACATETWPWFEDTATYDNARLCEALILVGHDLGRPRAVEAGLKALRWLVSIQLAPKGHFRPIGSCGFYARHGGHADFDQQPLEAQAMVEACLGAHRISGENLWRGEAKRAFEWFLGRNDLGLALYDPGTGGCADGLHADRLNENEGAESTLAFHLARARMQIAEAGMNGAGGVA